MQAGSQDPAPVCSKLLWTVSSLASNLVTAGFQYVSLTSNSETCDAQSEPTSCNNSNCSWTSRCVSPKRSLCDVFNGQETQCKGDRSCSWHSQSGECRDQCLDHIEADMCTNSGCVILESCTHEPEEDVFQQCLSQCPELGECMQDQACAAQFTCVSQAHENGGYCGLECYEACGINLFMDGTIQKVSQCARRCGYPRKSSNVATLLTQ